MNTSHRPWLIPNRPWVMKQTWYNLLFAHWEIDPEIIQSLIPKSLTVDTYNGKAWLAVVPFQMSGIRLRYLPEIPYTSEFPEINVRTYVTYQNKPGVYFFSLDATNYLAVQVAKTFFHLPYFFSKITVKNENEQIFYESKRLGSERDYHFKGIYQPVSEIFYSEFGSLEYWLTERYCLYTTYQNRLFRGEIHHEKWPLQHAEADFLENTMVQIEGLSSFQSTPLLHFAKKIDVLLWSLDEV
jgi:uncharacterized protein